jgi:hypothetical protein
MDTINEQIRRMNTLLTAVSFQITERTSAAPGVVINQQFCSSTVVLDLLSQLKTHTTAMDEIIRILQDPSRIHLTELEAQKKKRKDKVARYMYFFGAVGLFVAGFYAAKRMGMRKML